MRSNIFALFLVVALLLTGCSRMEVTPVEYNEPGVDTEHCVHPESDNSHYWSATSCVEITTIAFTVVVSVFDGITNHTELNASASGYGYAFGGYGSAAYNYRMWQDGKGLLPVTIISIYPEFHGLEPGDNIILKTTDLKAMSLPVGAEATFVCNEDVEVISPVKSGQTLTTDRITYELDDCRMLTPEYFPPLEYLPTVIPASVP